MVLRSSALCQGSWFLPNSPRSWESIQVLFRCWFIIWPTAQSSSVELFYRWHSRNTGSRERPRLDRKFHRNLLACSVDPRGSLPQQELFMRSWQPQLWTSYAKSHQYSACAKQHLVCGFRWREHRRNMWLRSLRTLTTVSCMMTCPFPLWLQVPMSQITTWDSPSGVGYCALCAFCHSPCLRLTHKIVEYEDYDNTTDLAQVNEYEYEDERYGPAEREREVLLNTQVTVQIFLRGAFLFIHSSLANGYIWFLFLGFTRERTKRRTRILRSGKKSTHWLKNMHCLS